MHGSCISELSEFSTATSMVHKPNNWQNQFEWYLHAWNLCYFRSLLDSSSHCTVWKQNWMFSSCWVIFFTTNLKRKKAELISWPIWGALKSTAYLRTFVSSISLIPNTAAVDSRQALLLRIERHRRPGETIQGPMDGASQVVWKIPGVLGFGQSFFLLIRKPLKKWMKINKQTYVKRLVWLSHPMFSGQKLEVFWTIILGSSPYFNLEIAATSNLMVRCISVKWRLLKCTVIHPKDLS